MVHPTGYKYYIKRDSDGKLFDLESDFPLMKIREVSGLCSFGKVKNIEVESYPEADMLRVFETDNPKFEPTKVVIRTVFVGSDRQNCYKKFCESFLGRKVQYWDNNRGIKVPLLMDEPIEIKDELRYGNIPYFLVDFPFKNISGKMYGDYFAKNPLLLENNKQMAFENGTYIMLEKPKVNV